MTSDATGASPPLGERLRRAWTRLRGGTLSPGRAAASVGVGLFVACLPLYGAQLLIVLLLCLPLRLDSALAYIVTHVSNPLTLPVFLWLELQIGSRVLTGHGVAMRFEDVKRLGLATVGTQIAVGAMTSAAALGTAGALLTWVVAHRLRDARHRDLADARRRTLSRYAGAPRRARSYVAIKLRTDPALAAIAALDGDFGRVVDAGCGYLQIGLTLFELGRVTSLLGYDADAERTDVARGAARSDARVERADLRALHFPEADTILFVDSLHYLPLEAQDDVLTRAARALAPGGRIIVRDVDSGASLRSGFTERLERNAARKRGAADGLAFRSASDIATRLERLGLTCTIAQHDDLSIVHNALVVGRRPA
ncbi:MAG TPA: DUF2062 domain-containing protein [Polyangiaceae bacterium]|nr:DUF2062 domain-containing protein [Polyangiaceae bacterium]